jgi:hypothetical protein
MPTMLDMHPCRYDNLTMAAHPNLTMIKGFGSNASILINQDIDDEFYGRIQPSGATVSIADCLCCTLVLVTAAPATAPRPLPFSGQPLPLPARPYRAPLAPSTPSTRWAPVFYAVRDGCCGTCLGGPHAFNSRKLNRRSAMRKHQAHRSWRMRYCTREPARAGYLTPPNDPCRFARAPGAAP